MSDPLSATSDEFRSTISGWVNESGEVLLLARLSRAAGRKDWYLVHGLGDLDTVVARSRPSDCLTAFSGRYLPNRAITNEETLARALDLVMSVEESLVGCAVALTLVVTACSNGNERSNQAAGEARQGCALFLDRVGPVTPDVAAVTSRFTAAA
jgi:hypothetical protein